ncbi:site-specific DNA-methyltransferase [Vibrio sp. 1288]|uniref:site-specific DNA-methyltransferase n=1 Tax=Vibrio sp. 1288 TaxID=3074550 RepID=UPI002967351E|nr:site-specific DNA-methyltransferase [Vibrio sp. 1288]MDW3136299.1 site-specific DNA-methyltransferase [Vibrio sp. 1288]
MPTLEFKGKQFVYSHHLSVPFRELKIDSEKSLPKSDSKPSLDDNLIIHGDNLEGLKALLPTHAGKVDCIFIDPPYNTGNEGWCYNDNVRSPLMQEWLKKAANPVDKEDLERHDKWLCMMWPRVQLLRELLSEEGSIWMTLDDNEIHRARMLFDEVFGSDNFVACCAWEKTYTPKSNGRVISTDHDYVLIYSKTQAFVEHGWNYLSKNEEQVSRYTNPDNDPKGPWRTYPLDVRTEDSAKREKYRYPITLPSGRVVKPAKGRHWALPEHEFEKQRAAGEIYFGKSGDALPNKKSYYNPDEDKGVIARSWWSYKETKGNQDAKKKLLEIFGEDESDFITPKPYQLIERVLEIATDKDSLILDSFAGSGTTAQAVLEANKKDGGSRKFILIECEDYADHVTAERVRRVISGYSFGYVPFNCCYT